MRVSRRCSWQATAFAAALVLTGCTFCKRSETGVSADPSAAPPATIAQPVVRGQAGPLLSTATWALIAGVLSFESPSLSPFSPRHRKDQELYDTLRKRGVPAANMELLLDNDVTAVRVKEALERLAKRAPPGATLIFYYAGHGMRDKVGEPYFAAYDTGDDVAATAISITDVAERIAAHFRGSRVLLMGDCCYSGALRNAANDLVGKGISTISLTSADASNLSTANWTFTQTVIDAMNGDPLCDRDQNGEVTLAELDREVADAMKFREKQRHGFVTHDVPMDLAIGAASGRRSSSPGPHAVGQYVEASYQGRWSTARVVEAGPARSLVRFYQYSDAIDVPMDNASLRNMQFAHFPEGRPVRVFWGGKIWDAKIVKVDGDFHKITYPGWPAYWDEWILSNRIAGETDLSAPPLAVGKHVQVEWQGDWYPAVILRREGARYLIHYDGYDASWDEWVTQERMRE